MQNLFKFASRNLLRHKRRSILSLVSIVFASLLVSFLRFFNYGAEQDAIWQAVRNNAGFIQIAANGYKENPSLDRALDFTADIPEKMAKAGVGSYSPRIQSHALSVYKEKSRFVSVLALDAEKEKSIIELKNTVVEGGWIKEEGTALVGYRLAKRLNLKLGSTFSLIGSQFDGSVGAVNVRLTGIFNSRDNELDETRVILPLATGEKLYQPHNAETGTKRYTSLIIQAADMIQASKIHERLMKVFPKVASNSQNAGESDNYSPVVLFWPDLIPGLVQLISFNQIGNNLLLELLIIIMSFGIVNTVQMSIRERRREFGILMALGTRSWQIVHLILLETGILLLAGMTVGFALGIGVAYYFQYHPIVLTGNDALAFIDTGYTPVLRCLVDAGELWMSFISISIPTLIFVIFSLRSIFKLQPVEVIQETL